MAAAPIDPVLPVESELVISADSHVVEPLDLWEKMPPALLEKLPPRPEWVEIVPGATNPADRSAVALKDTISMEVLYPTIALDHYAIEDPAAQEMAFRIYNDWLAEYCEAVPGRLVGVPLISTYNIDHGIAELQRCAEMGLKGALVWSVPPEKLSYRTNYYDRLWAVASEMDNPINLHIVTGFTYLTQRKLEGLDRFRGRVEFKVVEGINALFDFIFSGVFDRFPQLKMVLVEFEVGWIPWILQQWDYYIGRHTSREPVPIKLLPSEYFSRQVFASFIRDAVAATHFATGWGVDNCMWSNDFPHGNGTWPKSREVIVKDLGGLDPAVRARLLRENVAELYHLEIPTPVGS